MNNIRMKRAIQKANVFKGTTTVEAITNQIPQELIDRLYSNDLALVIEAVNNAYHNGKVSAGAEMIDSNAVWINSLNKGIEWKEVGAEYEMQDFDETKEGFRFRGVRSIKVKDGELVASFLK